MAPWSGITKRLDNPFMFISLLSLVPLYLLSWSLIGISYTLIITLIFPLLICLSLLKILRKLSSIWVQTKPLDLMVFLWTSINIFGALLKVIILDFSSSLLNDSSKFDRINYAVVTLNPKVDVANLIQDFRPISLLNCFLKIFTNVIANKLTPLFSSLVDESP